MKIRNGFVSNSSSSSFLIDFKEEINSPEDLSEYINENAVRDLSEDFKKYSMCEENISLTKREISEFLYKVISFYKENDSAKSYAENFDFKEQLDYLKETWEEINDYSKYREDKLKKRYGDDWKEKCRTELLCTPPSVSVPIYEQACYTTYNYNCGYFLESFSWYKFLNDHYDQESKTMSDGVYIVSFGNESLIFDIEVLTEKERQLVMFFDDKSVLQELLFGKLKFGTDIVFENSH